MISIRSLWLRQEGHFQEVLKGASWALLIRVGGAVTGFLVSFAVAKMLGAEDVGLYFLVVSAVAVIATVSRLGLDNAVVRFVAHEASAMRRTGVMHVYRVAIALVTISSMLLALALWRYAPWISSSIYDKPKLLVPLRIIAPAIPLVALYTLHSDALRGLRKIPQAVLIKTAGVSSVTLLLVYPLAAAMGVNGAVTAYAIATLVIAVMAFGFWWYFSKRLPQSHADLPDRGLLTKGLRTSAAPLFGITLTALAFQQAGTQLLGVWGSSADVGIYGVANKIASLLQFPLLAFVSILAPKFAAFFQAGDVIAVRSLAQKSSMLLTAIALPATIIVALFAAQIVGVFGESFEGGNIALRILLIGVFVNCVTGAVAELMIMSGHEMLTMIINVISVLVLIAISFIAIPRFGATGAALAVTAGLTMKNIWLLFMVRIKYGFWPAFYVNSMK